MTGNMGIYLILWQSSASLSTLSSGQNTRPSLVYTIVFLNLEINNNNKFLGCANRAEEYVFFCNALDIGPDHFQIVQNYFPNWQRA